MRIQIETELPPTIIREGGRRAPAEDLHAIGGRRRQAPGRWRRDGRTKGAVIHPGKLLRLSGPPRGRVVGAAAPLEDEGKGGEEEGEGGKKEHEPRDEARRGDGGRRRGAVEGVEARHSREIERPDWEAKRGSRGREKTRERGGLNGNLLERFGSDVPADPFNVTLCPPHPILSGVQKNIPFY